jgi:integral membrane sensor domain MASE1
MDSTTTWLLILVLFVCGANTGALVHARTGLPAGRPFWPGLLISVPLAAIAAAQLGGASRIAKMTIGLVGILCCVIALVLLAKARVRHPASG